MLLFATQLYFNSTMVRLKDEGAKAFIRISRYFNSTMVRLKGYGYLNSNLANVVKFQFHYGTIKRFRFYQFR